VTTLSYNNCSLSEVGLRTRWTQIAVFKHFLYFKSGL